VDHFNSTLTIADILSPSCGETVFKVRFGHGLLISHTIVSQLPQENLAQVRLVHPFSFTFMLAHVIISNLYKF
jgi:hypothetical protein